MDKLITVIGLAPSELPFTDLISKLTKERNRVRAAFETFRAKPGKTIRAKKTKPISFNKQIQQMITDGLITQEEVLKILGGKKE